MRDSKRQFAQLRSVVTRESLEAGLGRLGIREGGIVLVHASLSALGYVVHGANAALTALQNLTGPEGTLLFPAFTGDLTDPSCWVDPAVPPASWEMVRASMLPFDKQRTLPSGVGQLPMAAMADPNSQRSDHPLCSFLALGKQSHALVREQSLTDPFGVSGPLAKAMDLNAQVLLLGVDQRSNSAIAHAHVLANPKQLQRKWGSFLVSDQDGESERRWVAPERFVECTEGYSKIEDDLVSRGLLRVARVGDTDCRLMDMRSLVDVVEHMLKSQPERVLCGRTRCRQCA